MSSFQISTDYFRIISFFRKLGTDNIHCFKVVLSTSYNQLAVIFYPTKLQVYANLSHPISRKQ